MIETGSAAYQALYCDDDGTVINLDEVQYLDPVPTDRLPILYGLLGDDDPYACLQAVPVLVAWADPRGLRAAADLVENEAIDTGMMPHRLWGVDTAWDELASALAIAHARPQHDGPLVDHLVEQLLARFERHFFDRGMHRLSLAVAKPVLLGPLLTAMHRASAAGKIDQAALLLEAIASIDPQVGWQTISLVVVDGAIPGTGPG